MKMETWWSNVLLLLVTFSTATRMASSNYTRQPPGKVIFTPHSRSDFDPQQVHVSLAAKNHMRVSWITDNKTVLSVVEYGKMSGVYDSSATGEFTSYKYFFYSSGKIHHVRIGPLDPATTYYYKCGGFGPEFSLITPPSTFPIEFAVAGDLGQTEWTASTLAHVKNSNYDVFLSPGDLSYADSQQQLWDSFGRLVEPYTSHRPWMVTQGNHEIETFPIIYPHGFISYNSRWVMPFKESGSTSNLYYSFDVAGSHIVMLASYTEFDVDSLQYKWFRDDLASVDKCKTPWIIVVIHAPWYSTNIAHKGEGERMRKSMEEMLYNAQVDIVFAGHVHAYERFTRVYNNEANPCGPIHITIGDGGNREGLALAFEAATKPTLSMYREPSFGHGRLKILNETHAHWSWHRNNDNDSVMADTVWLRNLSMSKVCNKSEQKRVVPSTEVASDEL